MLMIAVEFVKYLTVLYVVEPKLDVINVVMDMKAITGNVYNAYFILKIAI